MWDMNDAVDRCVSVPRTVPQNPHRSRCCSPHTRRSLCSWGGAFLVQTVMMYSNWSWQTPIPAFHPPPTRLPYCNQKPYCKLTFSLCIMSTFNVLPPPPLQFMSVSGTTSILMLTFTPSLDKTNIQKQQKSKQKWTVALISSSSHNFNNDVFVLDPKCPTVLLPSQVMESVLRPNIADNTQSISITSFIHAPCFCCQLCNHGFTMITLTLWKTINYFVASSHFPLYVTYHTGDEWLSTNK